MIDGSQVYRLCRVGHHHHHSVCIQCGAVEEFRVAAVERLISAISAEIPGEVIDHRIELYVVCGFCPSDGGVGRGLFQPSGTAVTRAEIRDLNARIDRLTLAALGIGGGVIVALISLVGVLAVRLTQGG